MSGDRATKVRRRELLKAGLLAAAAATAGARRLRAQPAAPAPAAVYTGSDVVDVHCHVFNASDLPITGFLAHHITGLSDLSRELTRVPETIVRKLVQAVHGKLNAWSPGVAEEAPFLAKALADRALIGPVTPALTDTAITAALATVVDQLAALFDKDATSIRAGVGRIVSLLKLVSHERARVAATLVTTYPTVRLFTPCLVDYDAWSQDSPETPLSDQIQLHGMIAKLSMNGLVGRADARLHPFIAFDPLREVVSKTPSVAPYRPYGAGAPPFTPGQRYRCPAAAVAPPLPAPAPASGGIEMVRYAIEQAGFVGIKLYPPVGFLPMGNAKWLKTARGADLDQALSALYSYCEAEEVPITVHTSPANGYALGFGDLPEPNNWIPALKAFPRLRLNLAHMGHDHGAGSTRGVEACEAWIRQAAALMSAYPHVFADMANSPLVYDPDYRARFTKLLQEIIKRYPGVNKRLMYGSDWWLNRLDPSTDAAVDQFTQMLDRDFSSLPDARADVMGRNALRFLGFIDDANRFDATNRNRLRLKALYAAAAGPAGGIAAPAWLG